MKKDGYSENTIEPIGRRLRNLAGRVDLNNPGAVKELLARAEWSNGYKQNIVNAYNHYAMVHGLSWKRPRYQRASSIKKVPLEVDIDLIISYTRTRNRAAFKLIKECGLRPIEVSRLTLAHFDLNRRIVYPETAKGGAARTLELKKDTLALIKQLIADKNRHKNIFPKSKTLQKNWSRLRNKLAERYGKPELKQIRLYDLRHFYATMLYHRTKDILLVKRRLGHRRIENTLIYTHLVDFPNDEWICRVAREIKQPQELIARALAFINRSISYRKEKPRRKFGLAVTLKEANKLIGGCGLYVTNPENKEGYVGYCLNRTFWRKGYATETADALLEFGFQRLDLHRIFATVDPDNIAPTHVLRKIGMEQEGRLREHKWKKVRWHDSFLYAILETEWREIRDKRKE